MFWRAEQNEDVSSSGMGSQRRHPDDGSGGQQSQRPGSFSREKQSKKKLGRLSKRPAPLICLAANG